MRLAEAAATALRGIYLVDDYEVPLPDDTRWRLQESAPLASGKKIDILMIGTSITTSETSDMFIDYKRLPRTKETNDYARQVWRAYNQRELDKLKADT